MSPKIFISYSRQDERQALALRDLLRTEGWSVWIDQDAIEMARNWSGEIVDNIKTCDIFIVLLSNHSATSHNVSKELAIASENKKIIFPIELEHTTLPSPLQYALAGIQTGNYKDKDALLRSLHRFTDTLIGAEQQPVTSKRKRFPFKYVSIVGAVVILAIAAFIFINRKPSPVAVNKQAYIAILPFRVVNFDQDSLSNLDIYSEALITRISTISDLALINRRKTAQYLYSDESVVSIGKELGSRFVIDGTIRKKEDRLQISVRLYDLNYGADIWSKEMQGGNRELLSIRDSFVIAVAGKLEEIMGDEARLAKAEKNVADHPNDAEAYFQLAFFYIFKDKIKSSELFEKAIALNPTKSTYYLNLALEYDRMGKKLKIREVTRKGIALIQPRIDSNTATIDERMDYVSMLDVRGDHDHAIEFMNDFIRKLPSFHIKYEPTVSYIFYNASCILARNNKMLDLALDYLDSAEVHNPTIENKFSFAISDPDMDNLRKTERFRKIIYGE